MGNVWFFDLDGTLLEITHDYSLPMLEAAEIIIEVLGIKAPYAPQLLQIITETDRERVDKINPATNKPYKYSMQRFPTSLVAVYCDLCDECGVMPEREIMDLLYRVGLKAFDEGRFRKNIKDHTEDVLRFLASEGDAIVLVTKGDREVQQRKVQVFRDEGLDLFDEVVLVEHSKTPDLFRKLLEKHKPNDGVSVSVGNNYHKDIVPALEAGVAGGIYIPEFTWEERTPDETHESCIELEELNQILDIYPRLSDHF